MSLSRIKKILKIFHYPQKNFFAFHVAGSKGKGSVCAFAASILRQCGYTTGLYTSPHLHDVKERIRILKPGTLETSAEDFFEGKISQYFFNTLIYKIWKKTNKKNVLTYFEVLTCLAFLYFARKKVDVAVIETGLGGRLDATNTLGYKMCAMTPVGLEHKDVLGPSLGRIAAEKAAIIHRQTFSVITAPQEKNVAHQIALRAKKLGVKTLWIHKDVFFKIHRSTGYSQTFSVKTQRSKYSGLQTTLLGSHQAMNAAMAISMVEHFLELQGKRLNMHHVKKGVRDAFWPGRFEILKKKPFVVLDVAHTKESVSTLIKTFQKTFKGKKAIIVIGMLKDKDRQGICRSLQDIAKEVILTKVNHPRSHIFTPKEASLFFPKARVQFIANPLRAVKTAVLRSQRQDVVIVTGSIFLISEIRKNA